MLGNVPIYKIIIETGVSVFLYVTHSAR